jgi:hypothetical protein
MMFKLIYNIIYRRMPRPAMPDATPGNDPLSHPAISAMGPDDLADLPLATARRAR